MDRLPLFLDLKGQKVLLVGGGIVAARKCRLLESAGAQITIVAPELAESLASQATGAIRHIATRFLPSHLDGMRLVIAASRDPQVNASVAREANTRGIWVNVVDNAELSSAIMPSIVDRSPVIVAVSTGGASPVLARRLRARLESLLEPSLGPLARLLAAWRPRFLQRWPDSNTRRLAVDRLLDGRLPQQVAAGDLAAANTSIAISVRDGSASSLPMPGRVTLVGAGPGDPELLTLKALRSLQRADVILHDRLVSAEILSLARRDADLVDVGKTGGGPSFSQERINALLLEHARAGRQVVRLKGGDPCIFGRGSEEWDFLSKAGIAVDVVPGITTALALSLAGIALTQRNTVAGVRLLTAQRAAGAPEPDWRSWATSQDTLVIYMATPSLSLIRDQLLSHGMRADMPIAIVERLSLPGQRVVRGELREAPALAKQHAIGSPSILVIGDVAAASGANGDVGAAIGQVA